ncbi:MAG: pyruvate dehydrogenase (acetyl-transferring) E1 component subunit alpha [Nevskia sp.]
MTSPDPATRKVASYDVYYTQILNPDASINGELPAFAKDREQLRAMYELMVMTRLFDKKAVALQRTGLLGTFAAALGQEAIGVAIGHTLKSDDVFIPAYREYGAQFARGVPMRDILLYWGGDERGMDYPKGTAAYHDFPLSVPIATHVPHAIGVGYAMKLQDKKSGRTPRVVLSSCGDGATSKGDFYEAVSCAKIWNLPVVFLVNNNGWAISMPSHRQTGAQTFAQKAFAGGMSGEQVDGNDIIATRQVLARAIEKARSGGGPSLVETLTYRLHDHTTADDARRYRPEEEVKAAWERDPLKRYRTFMEAHGHWTAAEEDALISAGTAKVEAAAQEFLKMAPQAPEAIFDHLYATLPKSLQWQRDEVAARGPVQGAH